MPRCEKGTQDSSLLLDGVRDPTRTQDLPGFCGIFCTFFKFNSQLRNSWGSLNSACYKLPGVPAKNTPWKFIPCPKVWKSVSNYVKHLGITAAIITAHLTQKAPWKIPLEERPRKCCGQEGMKPSKWGRHDQTPTPRGPSDNPDC